MRELTVMEAIRGRRSVRSFRPDPIDDATVKQLLDAAVHAPTAVHEEPWEFVVVQDRALLRRISDQAKRTLPITVPPHVAAALPETAAFVAALRSPEFNIFYDAGTLIVIGARQTNEFVVADCWLAAENLMLAAYALGLGTCVIGSAALTLNDPEVKTGLGIPTEVRAIAPIIVGVPREVPPESTRKPARVLSWKK